MQIIGAPYFALELRLRAGQKPLLNLEELKHSLAKRGTHRHHFLILGYALSLKLFLISIVNYGLSYNFLKAAPQAFHAVGAMWNSKLFSHFFEEKADLGYFYDSKTPSK